MNDKVLIVGAGYIGRRLQRGLDCELSERVINSFKDAQDLLSEAKPQILINCIGNLGRNVDECDKDPDKTLFSNTFVPVILAEAALRSNVRFINISTGCIYHYDYEKDKPVREDKEPDFFELFYSRSKIYSDKALQSLFTKHPILIVRIRVPLDNRPDPKNLLTKLINYKKAIDISNSVTYMPDFIDAVKHLVRIKARGIYNVACKGALFYPKLLEIYKKYVPDFKYEVLEFKKLNIVRTNLILSTDKLEASGFKVRTIEEILEECVKAYLKY
ncbi:NAD-dependent epimerase/dehydratase family protein [Candidatus Omnitrophota bacterium]